MSPSPAPSLLVPQPSEETEEDLLENQMEDSGQGLDIESSRVVSTSDEEESLEVENSLRASRGAERRRPRRSRVAYKVSCNNLNILSLFHVLGI